MKVDFEITLERAKRLKQDFRRDYEGHQNQLAFDCLSESVALETWLFAYGPEVAQIMLGELKVGRKFEESERWRDLLDMPIHGNLDSFGSYFLPALLHYAAGGQLPLPVYGGGIHGHFWPQELTWVEQLSRLSRIIMIVGGSGLDLEQLTQLLRSAQARLSAHPEDGSLIAVVPIYAEVEWWNPNEYYWLQDGPNAE